MTDPLKAEPDPGLMSVVKACVDSEMYAKQSEVHTIHAAEPVK